MSDEWAEGRKLEPTCGGWVHAKAQRRKGTQRTCAMALPRRCAVEIQSLKRDSGLLPKRPIDTLMHQQEQQRSEQQGSPGDGFCASSLGSRIELRITSAEYDHDY